MQEEGIDGMAKFSDGRANDLPCPPPTMPMWELASSLTLLWLNNQWGSAQYL